MPSALIYPALPEIPRSPDFRLWLDDVEVPVYHSSFASFHGFGIAGAVQVAVLPSFAWQKAVVRPLSRAVASSRTADNRLTFTLDRPGQFSIEFDDQLRKPLLIFADAPEADRPAPDAPGVRYFAAGMHRPEPITLGAGETLYLEPGAVLRTTVTARDGRAVRILGRGVLDGSDYHREERRRETPLRILNCGDVLVEGVTFFNSTASNINIAGSESVTVRGIKILAHANSDDGIPVIGSHGVTIESSFIRTKDDCVTLKAVERRTMPGTGMADVYNVVVQGCVLWNAEWGNALEIGYETRCESMHHIVFRDCDIIHCEYEGWQSGGALTIHNGDRATIRDVLYDDIRVEDAQEKLIDVKILTARYTRDDTRGKVEDITFRNVRVVDGPFPVSIIRGFDGGAEDHVVRRVRIENLSILGERVKDWRQARMVLEIAREVTFA